jgi:uncharacterized protein (DUF736 family)
MANIGSFKKSGQEFQGEIVTLSLQTKGVRIVPETDRTSDNAPSHRVYVGRAEIGAAWPKRSSEGRDYLSVKLDDPKHGPKGDGAEPSPTPSLRTGVINIATRAQAVHPMPTAPTKANTSRHQSEEMPI